MEGHVAIVTGGAMGIGLEYAKVLLSRKLKVCIADINEAKGLHTVTQLQKEYTNCDIMFEKCDVTKTDDLDKLFKNTVDKFGRLDVLVNNAGIMDESKPELTLAINMHGTINGTMKALEYMSTSRGGRGGVIINIGSITSFYAAALSPFYGTSKHAVLGFSRNIGATSIEMYGVRVNCICPSYVETELLSALDTTKLYGPTGAMDRAQKVIASYKLLSTSTVAACLNPILDDAKMSGAAILCSNEHPQTVLKLPTNLADIHELYVPKQ